jgi:Glycosyltransferase
MRVAFLANSFHLKMTKSSDFFIEFLKGAFNEVQVIPLKEAWVEVPKRKWDMLVVFMALVPPQELEAFHVPRVALVPMYDNCPHTLEFWEKYRQFKVVCLSKTLHSELERWGLNTFGAQYYPPVSGDMINRSGQGLQGFFWPRTAQLGWTTIRKLIGDTQFEKFHLHWTRELNPDLSDLPGPEDTERFSITTSSWFQSQAEYGAMVRAADVFFASRRIEGIGMSFLEAMAWGKCVVAPNAPVMNEYIRDGENGILYDPDEPAPADFSRWESIGKAAYESTVKGRREWMAALGSLKNFLEAEVSNGMVRPHHVLRARKRGYVALRAVYRISKKILRRFSTARPVPGRCP